VGVFIGCGSRMTEVEGRVVVDSSDDDCWRARGAVVGSTVGEGAMSVGRAANSRSRASPEDGEASGGGIGLEIANETLTQLNIAMQGKEEREFGVYHLGGMGDRPEYLKA